MSEFKREIRYTVIKHSQLTENQMQYLKGCIFGEGIPTVKAVVVEADWPEHEHVWRLIEDRVSGAPVEGGKSEYDAMAQAMTTNQTIDGVPRVLLENLASYAEGSASVEVQLWVKKLNAMLDAPADERRAVKRYDRDSVAGHCDVEIALPEQKILHHDHGPNLAEALARLAGRVARFHKLEAPSLAAQPQGEPGACAHEWTDDGEHLLVCTACGAQEDHDPGWQEMDSAPRDGTMLRLLVEFEEHSTEDADQAPTIGVNNFDNDGEDRWKFAGWCWSHDHFTAGKGVPIGWLLLLDGPKLTAAIQTAEAP